MKTKEACIKLKLLSLSSHNTKQNQLTTEFYNKCVKIITKLSYKYTTSVAQ